MGTGAVVVCAAPRAQVCPRCPSFCLVGLPFAFSSLPVGVILDATSRHGARWRSVVPQADPDLGSRLNPGEAAQANQMPGRRGVDGWTGWRALRC